MSDFKREDRYIVIKRSDMEKLPADTRRNFQGRCRRFYEQMLIAGAPARSFLVIESDWPEYEPAWQMIERRITDQPAVTAAEELDAVLHWRGKHTQAIRERDALQHRLTAADERNDEAIDLLRRARAVIEGGGWADLEKDIARFFKPAESRNPSTCTWSEGGFSWHTGCGKEWQFTDGGLPAENGMRFCHSCGKTLVAESGETP